MANTDLHNAKTAKKDEFYTQLTDIEKEMKYYKDHFKNKHIFLNCDDPEFSNFWRYFAINFKSLELKQVTSTHYDEGVPTYRMDMYRNAPKEAYYKETFLTLEEIGIELPIGYITPLEGDGDFRSQESIEILKEADIVVTNPPFSLFREYIAQLMKFNKSFIIIGNLNAITYKEVFPLIQSKKIWLGKSLSGQRIEFQVPEAYPLTGPTTRIDEFGNRFIRINGSTRWFTNLDFPERYEDLILYKKYNPFEYPSYDNYDAIDVGKTSDIPMDYDGVMGVPITFIDKFNPNQFEILGMTSGRNEFEHEAWPSKRYVNAIQHNKDGSTTNGSKANTRATVLLNKIPEGKIYYTADNAEGPFEIKYARILVKKKVK